MMNETLTAYRLLHRSMDALREFIRPMNFDNKMDFYEYNEDFRQLRHLQSAVEQALSDPLLWDHFVSWNVSCDGYLRDQEDLIQNRIARHCLDYGGNCTLKQEAILPQMNGAGPQARMGVGNAAQYWKAR